MSKILITICIVDRMRGNGYQDLSRQILPSSWSSNLNPATVIPGDNINRWLGRSRPTDHRQVLLGRFTGMYSSDFCLKKIVQGPRQLLSFVNVIFVAIQMSMINCLFLHVTRRSFGVTFPVNGNALSNLILKHSGADLGIRGRIHVWDKLLWIPRTGK